MGIDVPCFIRRADQDGPFYSGNLYRKHCHINRRNKRRLARGDINTDRIKRGKLLAKNYSIISLKLPGLFKLSFVEFSDILNDNLQARDKVRADILIRAAN